MEFQSTIIQAKLDDGTVIHVEATPVGDQLVGAELLSFRDAQVAIESISKAIAETVQKVKPDRACIKFGLEIGVETTGLTALLAKGSSKANLEITLEWSK
jgi:hypothetical protein